MVKIKQRIIKHFKQYTTKTTFHTDNKSGIFIQPERTKAQSYCVVEKYISTSITAVRHTWRQFRTRHKELLHDK